MLWVCAGCGTRYAESLAACPHCGDSGRRADHEAAPDEDGAGEDGEEGDGMPKITTWGGASHPQEHPGYGTVMHGTEHPADGTMSPPVTNEDPGGAQDAVQVTAEPVTEADPGQPGDETPAPAAAKQAKRTAPTLSQPKKADGGG